MIARFYSYTGLVLFFHLQVCILHLAVNIQPSSGVATDCLTVKKECDAISTCEVLIRFIPIRCGNSVSECQAIDEVARNTCLSLLRSVAHDDRFKDCSCDTEASNYEECYLVESRFFRNPCADDTAYIYIYIVVPRRLSPPHQKSAVPSALTTNAAELTQDHQTDCHSAMKDCRLLNNCSKNLESYKFNCPKPRKKCKATSRINCLESIKNLTNHSFFTSCTCQGDIPKKKKCQRIYNDLFSHPCSYDESDDESLGNQQPNTMKTPTGCQMWFGEKAPFNVSAGSMVRRNLKKGCSEVCYCSTSGNLVRCNQLPCFSGLQCAHEGNVYKERGRCVCFEDELICSRPKSTYQTKIDGVSYLQIGYSVKERLRIQAYVDDNFDAQIIRDKLQSLIEVNIRERHCILSMFEKEEEGNLVLFANDLNGRINKTCLTALSTLNLKINNQRPEIWSDVVLSILKVASIHKTENNDKTPSPDIYPSTNPSSHAIRPQASAKCTLLFAWLLSLLVCHCQS